MKHLSLYLIVVLFALMKIEAYAQNGVWNGTLELHGVKIPLVFHFTDDGCFLDSPSQGAKGIKAECTLKDGSVDVRVPLIGARFEGLLVGDSIKGVFRQGSLSLPLTVAKGYYKAVRPQTPSAPFPYNTEELKFDNDGFTFGGTLTLPENYGKNTPVVLMITGSGQQNRDEEIFGHKPFAVIADYLARRGIASYRYDDRGFGDDSVSFVKFTTDDFMHDAAAAVAMLRKRFDKVGLLGHSEGGTIAFTLAAEGRADFVVSLAGMAVSGRETLVRQNRWALSSSGMSSDVLDSCCEAIDKAFGQMAEGKPLSEVSFDGAPPALKPHLRRSLAQADSPYMRRFITVDVSPLLSSVQCPVLALNGEKDIQVDCSTNLAALATGLQNCQKVIKSFAGMNHLFQSCSTGSVAEYSQIEETVSPAVLSTITDWILALGR